MLSIVIIVINSGNSDKQVGLYSGGGAYIWNEVSVSTCGGLIQEGGLYWGGGGGAYIRRLTVLCRSYISTWKLILIWICSQIPHIFLYI